MKRRTQILIVVGVVIAALSFVLAVKLTPWFYAINVRVRLYMDAPASTSVVICWDQKKTQCLPLVPYSSINQRIAQANEIADVWLSELPPRPTYSISLQFKSDVAHANFHRLELNSSNIFLQGYGKENGAGVNNLELDLNKFESVGVSVATGASSTFDAKANSFLVYKKDVQSGPSSSHNLSTTLLIWVLLLSLYLLIVLPISLLPDAIQNLDSINRPISLQPYSWPIYAGCVALAVVMVLMVLESGVLVYLYDPLSYILLATRDGWFNVSRLPGYPFFLGFALFITGYSLDRVILVQAVILAFSVVFCLWTLRKWISPYLALPFVFFSLFSPAQIFFARYIVRECLFASLVLLGVTAVIKHFTSPRPNSTRWLIFFTILCAAAFLVRENGIILPFALLPVLILETLKRWFSSGTVGMRISSVLSFLPQYALPFVGVAVVYGGFATHNYLTYGYFQIEEQQTSHGFLSRAMSPSNFDARGLLKPASSVDSEAKEYLGWQFYSSYILSRDLRPGDDQTYAAFYPALIQLMSQRHVPPSKFTPFDQASLLNEIGKNVDAFVSKRAVLCGILRQYIRVLYPVGHQFPLDAFSDLPGMDELRKQLPAKITMRVQEKPTEIHTVLAMYYRFTQRYPWYELLFVLALISSIYILKCEHALFLAPITVYLANCALVLYSRMVDARVFMNIDALLVLQIVLGFSLWWYRNSNAKARIKLAASV
jgi:hypothetical protein